MEVPLLHSRTRPSQGSSHISTKRRRVFQQKYCTEMVHISPHRNNRKFEEIKKFWHTFYDGGLLEIKFSIIYNSLMFLQAVFCVACFSLIIYCDTFILISLWFSRKINKLKKLHFKPRRSSRMSLYRCYAACNIWADFQSQGRSHTCMLSCMCDPWIHLWCNTCWMYWGPLGSQVFSIHVLADYWLGIGGVLWFKQTTTPDVKNRSISGPTKELVSSKYFFKTYIYLSYNFY